MNDTRQHRFHLSALTILLAVLAWSQESHAQIIRYEIEVEGELCLFCNQAGDADVVIEGFSLSNLQIQWPEGRVSLDVPPESELTPDQVEGALAVLGLSIRSMLVTAVGVVERHSSGITFRTPSAVYPLSVPESHLFVEELMEAGLAPQTIRAQLSRNATGDAWTMRVLPPSE